MSVLDQLKLVMNYEFGKLTSFMSLMRKIGKKQQL